MAVIKCKMCGGDLEVSEDMTVAECEYCGTKQTVPKVDDEKKIKLFERANRLRKACEFDKAAGVYESIIADFDTESEAYWGLVLCKYGIEYVDDPATKKKVPTCHRSSFESVMKDANLELALENADLIAQRVYREEAKQIEEIRKGIIEVSSKEEPYDVFISYKELDENGERTVDSVIAQDIYKELNSMGYRVFFSRISLESKLGTEYEPYIFAALNSAKVMLVVGTSYENFNAVWVKNEWSRFLALIARGEKKTLIPIFKDIDAYDMPEEFAKLSAQNMAKIGAMQDLTHGIEKLIPLKKAEAVAAVPAQQAASPNVDSLLKRGMMFLEDKDWNSADEYFNKVLDIDPENGEAYYGKLMVELEMFGISEIKPSESGARRSVTSAKAYKRFEQFSTEERKAELEAQLAECAKEERIAVKRKAEEERIERERRAEADRIAAEKAQEEKTRRMKELVDARERAAKFGRMIAAGFFHHSLGLKANGTVTGVGYSKNGQCDVSDWKDITGISAGKWHSVGLRSNGTVLATVYSGAGMFNCGQCLVYDWTDIVAVATGEYHSAGLKKDGTVVTTEFTTPRLDCGQGDVSDWTDIIAIAAGNHYTVGLKKDGTVVSTKLRALPTALHEDRGQCRVDDWTDIAAITAGGYHTVGLHTDGTVVAVGKNDEGQCKVSDWTDIVAVSAGGWHTVGLRADGTVVAVGRNKNGQCNVSGWKNVVAISAGSWHTLGLCSDGTVVAVGCNQERECNVSGWKLFNSVDTYDEEIAKLKQGRIAELNEEKAKLTAELPTIKGMFAASKKEKVEARLAAIDKEIAELQ